METSPVKSGRYRMRHSDTSLFEHIESNDMIQRVHKQTSPLTQTRYDWGNVIATRVLDANQTPQRPRTTQSYLPYRSEKNDARMSVAHTILLWHEMIHSSLPILLRNLVLCSRILKSELPAPRFWLLARDATITIPPYYYRHSAYVCNC